MVVIEKADLFAKLNGCQSCCLGCLGVLVPWRNGVNVRVAGQGQIA